MQAEVKITFDLEDEEETEKFGKVSKVLSGKDCCSEEEEEEEPDYKSALEAVKEKIQELVDEAKAGSATLKAFEKVQEEFDDIMSDNDIDLD